MAEEHREDAYKRVENEFFTLKYASEMNDNAEGYRTVSKINDDLPFISNWNPAWRPALTASTLSKKLVAIRN